MSDPINMAVRITLTGCDDATYIDMEVTSDEFVFLDRIAKRSEKASTYGCMPTLSVRRRTEADDHE